MFAAGLELDFKRLMRQKKQAMTFALLSFTVPFAAGIASAKALHYAWAGVLLMGSNWGSHTLVTYPMLRKMGLARNRAVGTVVGATSITDTSALLVLSAVSVSAKKSGSVDAQGAEIAVGLVLLVLYTLVVLPQIARWFFARVGGDRSLRLVFGIAAFLSGAVLAEMASIDGIVGAFLAGLGLNRVIPERSPLMEQVQFVGSALFIPIFLVSVGILLEPRVLIDPRTLLVAAIFTVAVLGGKTLAAVVAGRAFGYTCGGDRGHVGLVGIASGRHARDHPGGRAPGNLRQDNHQRSLGGHSRHARHHAGGRLPFRQESDSRRRCGRGIGERNFGARVGRIDPMPLGHGGKARRP